MATFVVLSLPVTILVTYFTNPDNLTNTKDFQSLTLVGPTGENLILGSGRHVLIKGPDCNPF